MKECNSLPLQAISPKNNFKDFYLKYQKRKKPFLLVHEKHFPQIKINTDNNYDSNEGKNNIKNIFDLPILSPLKTNNTAYFPKISEMRPRLINMKIQLGQKLEKNKRKLNIKYIDIINMNKDNKLLIYEINKVSQFEEEILRHIYDPITKNKITKEINIIDRNTKEEIKDIVNNITNEEKEEALKYFKVNPKIINLCAEDILKHINNQNNVYATIRSYDREKEIKKRNIKIKGNNSFSEEKLNLDFLMCAKNNIKRKIELRNQYNKEISIEYIEMLLKNELEKIKLILSLYLKDEQDENILFDIDGNETSGENIKEKIKIAKKNKGIDRYIKKLINLKNIFNDMIKTNYDDENYNNDTIMKNEITQYNYKDFSKHYSKDKNMIYNKKNDYINNILNESDNNEQNKNIIKSNELNKSNSENKNIFIQFEKFSRKRNNEKENMDLQKTSNFDKKDSMKNEKTNETLQRKTIHTTKNNIEIDKDSLMNNNNIKNSNSYKTSIENQKIVSKSNKDILSLLASSKYKSNDNIKKTNRQKVNGKIDVINQEKKEKEIKPIPVKTDGEILKNRENIKEYSKDLEKILKYENKDDINKEENNVEDSNKDNYSNINNNYEENEENEENEEYEDYEEYEDDENSNNNDEHEEHEEHEDNSNEELIKSKYIYHKNDNNLETDKNFISLNNDEQNIKNNKLNLLNNQQIRKKKEKHNLTKFQKKSKIKKKKIKKNMSPDKIKKSSPTKLEHSKSKSSNKKNNNNNNRNQRQIILTKDLITNNKSSNRNKVKDNNLFRKAIVTLNQVKKITTQRKERKGILDFEKTKRFKIKDFEYIEKEKPKRKLSFQNIIKVEKPKKQNEDGLNVIKLYDDDMEKIVNFINDEEKRRVKREKNAQRMAKEKIEHSDKSILYSLFKVKEKKKEEEKQDQDDLTKEDIVEKLKRDDWRTRQYIEDIVRAGLTMGNKELNKQMKNKTVLIFQGLELGTFKFKRNFGIKEEDINTEPSRPKSNKEQIHIESKKKEKDKKRISIINKEKKAKDKQKEKEEKEKEKQRKKEEAKKKLIYDNSYLFVKKKKSVNFILRKEIEEILHEGILLQQLANKEEEHITEVKSRFLPPKRPKFIKKKKNRGKLFRKSKFLKDVVDNEIIIPKKENDYSSSESVIKEESNNSFEDKMQTLIDRVKKFKKGEELNINEIENIMDQKINIRNKSEKVKENRIQGFMNTLNEYRDMNKNSRKKKNFFYKVPILIMANSEGD